MRRNVISLDGRSSLANNYYSATVINDAYYHMHWLNASFQCHVMGTTGTGAVKVKNFGVPEDFALVNKYRIVLHKCSFSCSFVHI